MWLIDLILNISALLLWLRWREKKSPQMEFPGISLAGTLKRTQPSRGRSILGFSLLGLLLIRSVFYWQLGSALNWTPKLPLQVLSLPFRSDFFDRIFVYSILSFLLTVAVYYIGLLFFSIVNGKKSDNDPFQRLISNQLGWVEMLPTAIKCLIPWLIGFLAWVPASWLIETLRIMPPAVSFGHRLEQAAIMGVAAFAVWKFVIAALLFLYLLNSYIYFGNSPFWNFVYVTGKRVLGLVSWIPLRIGRIDFAPVILGAVVIVGIEYGLKGLVQLYLRLPL